MKLKDVLAGAGILEKEINNICYNASDVKPGSLFVAIVGEKVDGHEYIDVASENGAGVIICQKPPEPDVPYIKVQNSRRALAILSSNFFGNPSSKLKIIGVTGTNGKTSTAYYIRHILLKQGFNVGLIGTNEIIIKDEIIPNTRTTPESYELHKLFKHMLESGCEYVVMEVSSHALALDRVYGIDFEVGVFTNLSSEHLDFHKTLKSYEKVKAKLISMSRKSVINIDDIVGRKMINKNSLTYSINNDEAFLTAKNIKNNIKNLEYSILTEGFIDRVTLNTIGEFTVYNTLAAILTCKSVGIELSDCISAIQSVKSPKGRIETVYSGDDFSVIIDYAHTDDGIKNILKTIKTTNPGRIVAIFGCGGNRDISKRELMAKACEEFADFIVVTSDNPRDEDPNDIINDITKGFSKDAKYIVIENRREAIKFVVQNAVKGDIIILMGKGHETYQEIKGKKIYLDEREEILNALNER